VRNPIAQQIIPGFEPDPNAKAQPIVIGRTVLHGGERRSGAPAPSSNRPRRSAAPGHAGTRGDGRQPATAQGRGAFAASAKPQTQRQPGRTMAKPATAGGKSTPPPERRADAWQGTAWAELDLPPHLRGAQGRNGQRRAGNGGQRGR